MNETAFVLIKVFLGLLATLLLLPHILLFILFMLSVSLWFWARITGKLED